MEQKTIDDVRRFWEANPLWAGESSHPSGSKAFYEEHRRTVVEDCFAGEIDERLLPGDDNTDRVLDLGCGPGFWTVELALHGCRHIVAADLTEKALELARKRCELYGVKADFSRQNAEGMDFPDQAFSHVNCQGVIHHTPNAEACVREIARVLRKGGTAVISVYYRNLFLRCWPVFRPVARMLAYLGAKMAGRGREDIYTVADAEDIVRRFDGKDNPVGKCYTRQELLEMVSPYFTVEAVFFHYFPARTLPFSIPRSMHRLLDRMFGFMIFLRLHRRSETPVV